MRLKDKNKMHLLNQLNEWSMDAFYANKSNYEQDDWGNYKGFNYRKFEATLKILRRLIREIK
jgi:hypothetical protein